MNAPRVLHLGLGRFHKAHQAWYFDRLNELQPDDPWLISAWSMRSPIAADELRAKNFHYPLRMTGSARNDQAGREPCRECNETREIRSIVETGFVHRDLEHFLARATHPETRLITLTITERGYAPDRDPRSAIALLALALERRAKAGQPPITVMSCDNLRANSQVLKRALATVLDERALESAFFASSMVDRIVPAGELRTETYAEWVIENHFSEQRPPLERVGALFVPDVTPFEDRKLRLLNGSHSLLAYTGLLSGHSFVHEATADPALRDLLLRLHGEVIPLLGFFTEDDLRAYARNVVMRFENPGLPYPLKQIATDGSIKLAQRIIPSFLAASARGMPRTALATCIAAWLKVSWLDLEHGPTLSDPITAPFREFQARDFRSFVTRALDLPLFAECARHPGFKAEISSACERI